MTAPKRPTCDSELVPEPPVPDETFVRDSKKKRKRLLQSVPTNSSIPPLTPASPAWSIRSSEMDPPDWWTMDLLDDHDDKHIHVRIALKELKQYFDEYLSASKDKFWCRKSGKTVLSVVICREEDSSLVALRGMNTEVSLPAGSLCAERSAISRAATDFHSSSSIVAVATVDPDDTLNPLWPCEVCQSWLSKLRRQSPEIAVIAITSCLPSFDSFVWHINGEYQLAPRSLLPAGFKVPTFHPSSVATIHWPERVLLAEGTQCFPWEFEAGDVVYIDGAWTFLHTAHLSILREAAMRGNHLLVGVHSDEVLRQEFTGPVLEPFDVRVGRILQNRHVSSVLKDAPWNITTEMIKDLGIKKVVSGSVGKARDGGKENSCWLPYKAAEALGILEVVTSVDDTTEKGIHEELKLKDPEKFSRL